MPQHLQKGSLSQGNGISIGGTGDIATPYVINGTTRTFAATIGPAVSTADYICTGTNDDVKIQAAINAVAAAGGGSILMLRGTYRISSTIVFPFNANVFIYGEKWAKQANGGVIWQTSASTTITDMIQVTGNANPTLNTDLSHDNGIFNITLNGNTTTTNLVKLTNYDTFHLYDSRLVGATNSIATVWNSTSDPISATVPGGLFIRNCIISANGGIGLDLQYQTQVWITDVWFSAGSSTATTWININACSKIHAQNIEFNTATAAIAFADTATVSTNDITFSGVTFASSGGAAWTDTRTNAGSDRVFISGTNLPALTTAKLTGTHNAIFLTNTIGPMTITSQSITDKPLVLKGFAGQTGRYFEVQNSGGTPLSFINSTGNYYAANGTVSLPGLAFTNDLASGFYRVSAGITAQAANGTQIAQFDSTSGVNLLLAPTAPTATAGTSTTQIATTAFVANAVTSSGAGNVSKASNSTATGIMQVSGGTDKSIADYSPSSAGALQVSSAGVPSIITNTGTGNNVLAISPSLTTPIISGQTISDATDITLGTTTGSKFGTSTTQKLGFFGVTPVVQQTAGVDLGTVLSNVGLRASGSAYPITTSAASAFSGNLRFGYSAVTTTTTLTTSSTNNQMVTASGGAVTMTLPTTTTGGYEFTIKKTDSSANTVTISPNGGTIDGQTSLVLSTQYASYTVVSTTNSNVWYIKAKI